jgi:hypothetical protein
MLLEYNKDFLLCHALVYFLAPQTHVAPFKYLGFFPFPIMKFHKSFSQGIVKLVTSSWPYFVSHSFISSSENWAKMFSRGAHMCDIADGDRVAKRKK